MWCCCAKRKVREFGGAVCGGVCRCQGPRLSSTSSPVVTSVHCKPIPHNKACSDTVLTPKSPVHEKRNSLKISPVCATSFSGLAPAMIVTAEMDVLRDTGEAYCAKMNEAGSKAEVIRVKVAPHSFSTIDEALDIGRQYNRDALRGLG